MRHESLGTWRPRFESLVYQDLLILVRADVLPARLWAQGGLGICRLRGLRRDVEFRRLRGLRRGVGLHRLRGLRSGAGSCRLRGLRRKRLDGK